MKTVYAATVAMRAAWAVLRQNRWRSLLTLAICGLGTSGVMVAGLLGEANLAEMQARLQTLGGGLLVVSPNKLPPYPGRVRQLEHFITLVPEDGKALSRLVPELTTVVPVVARDTVVRAGNAASRVRLIGTDPDYMRVRSFKLRKGRFFCSADGNQRVIVLGHSVAEEVFPFGARAGEMVTLRSAPFVVVGILEPQGINFAGEDEDHQVFIPLEAYQRRIANRPWLTFLYLQLSATQDPTGVVNMVGAVLRQRHGRFRDQVDDVVVRDLADLAAQQAGLLTTAVWAVSATRATSSVFGAGRAGLSARPMFEKIARPENSRKPATRTCVVFITSFFRRSCATGLLEGQSPCHEGVHGGPTF